MTETNNMDFRIAFEQCAGDDWTERYAEIIRLYNSGDSKKAIGCAEKAVKISKKQHGECHPATATSLNILAWLYENQGKHKLAEPLYHKAMELYKKALGPNHPE